MSGDRSHCEKTAEKLVWLTLYTNHSRVSLSASYLGLTKITRVKIKQVFDPVWVTSITSSLYDRCHSSDTLFLDPRSEVFLIWMWLSVQSIVQLCGAVSQWRTYYRNFLCVPNFFMQKQNPSWCLQCLLTSSSLNLTEMIMEVVGSHVKLVTLIVDRTADCLNQNMTWRLTART